MTETENDNLAMPVTEFVQRFTAELLRIVGPVCYSADDHDPQSTAEYAREVAPSYHEDRAQRIEGPEECARADHSYWGE